MVGPVIFDAVKRYLQYKGYDVTVGRQHHRCGRQADRRRPEAEHDHAGAGREVHRRISRCLATLGIDTIDRFPKASEHMPEIIEMCKKLIAKGIAYAADGNVWFDVTKDADYGKLSHRRSRSRNRACGSSKARASATRRLCPLESRQARRAELGFALGQGPAGLAHRMLRHEHQISRPDLRHARRRDGPDVPASRKRTGPIRKRHRQDRSSNTGCTTA